MALEKQQGMELFLPLLFILFSDQENRRAKQEQARLHRDQILAQVGLKKTEGGKLTTDVLPASIVDLEEESGFSCKV